MARFSSADNAFVVPKFSRARVRCCGVRAAHSVMRLCNFACSSADSVAKVGARACHLRFCAGLSVFQAPARGASDCRSVGLSSVHSGVVTRWPPLELAGLEAARDGWDAPGCDRRGHGGRRRGRQQPAAARVFRQTPGPRPASGR